MLKRSDVRNAGSWREPLLIDEALERLVALDALVIMELMQPAITYRRFEKHAKEYDGGVHRVAWGFLRPQGPGGQPLLGEWQGWNTVQHAGQLMSCFPICFSNV